MDLAETKAADPSERNGLSLDPVEAEFVAVVDEEPLPVQKPVPDPVATESSPSAEHMDPVQVSAPTEPEPRPLRRPELPKGFESLPQLLLYDDETNGDRLVRGVALDVRDIGGGLQVIMVKIREAVRMRRVVDGEIAEAPPKSIIAVPAIFDLVGIPAEMARDPVGDELGVLEVCWQLTDRFVAPGGVVVVRHLVGHRWVKGIGTRKELLA